jgi:hypothetical protein
MVVWVRASFLGVAIYGLAGTHEEGLKTRMAQLSAELVCVRRLVLYGKLDS